MAVCTSEPAPSMLRLSSNCKMMVVCPRVFTEFMEVMPAMVANCFSRGVATEEAMVSGSAPGRLATTWMVGKSMAGISETGSAS